MPKIPRTDLAAVPKGINPNVTVDPRTGAGEGVAAYRGSLQVMDESDRLFQTAIRMQEEKDALVVVDNMTSLRNQTRDYTLSLKERVGKNGINLQEEAREWVKATVDKAASELPTERQRNLFMRIAAGEVDQTLNQVAAHEYQQLTQYRNDLRQNSLNDSVLSIRNSAGNEQVIQKAIDTHLKQMGVIFPGQDIDEYHKADLSRLQLEAQTHIQHWRHTTVYNELTTKFAGDPEGAIKQLMDPNNYKEISVEEKQTISNIITSEFSRMKAFKKEQQEEQAQSLWADYYDVRFGGKRGQPGALAKWHSTVADLTRRGVIPSGIMLQAIQMEAAEQASQRAAAASVRAAEEYTKKNHPLMVDDPTISARWTEEAIKNPGSLDIEAMSAYVGKGLSYKTFEHLSSLKKSKSAAVWTSPNGRLIVQQLNQHRKNYTFDTNEEKNSEEFVVAFKRMEKFLLNNPDADATKMNAEMKEIMRPYTRGKILKMFDAIEGYMSGGPGPTAPPPGNVLEQEGQ